MDLEEAARGIRVPTLVLCGTSDIITPLRLSEKLTQLIPGSRLNVVDKAGHMLPPGSSGTRESGDPGVRRRCRGR